MKYIPLIIVVVIAILLLVACAPAIAKVLPSKSADISVAAATVITPADAKKRLDSEQGIILFDVREADEYATVHIGGSVLLPVDSIAAEAEAKLTDKDAVIFVYCRSGRRSAIAAKQLVKMGYTKVFDLGGIINWPYEVVKG